MNRAQQLAAIRTRTPDSIAPDGGMLRFIPISQVHPYHCSRRAPFTQPQSETEPTTLPARLAADCAARQSHNESGAVGTHSSSNTRHHALSSQPNHNHLSSPLEDQ